MGKGKGGEGKGESLEVGKREGKCKKKRRILGLVKRGGEEGPRCREK